MKVAISILFDSAYIESALVTAHDVLVRFQGASKIYLIYLLSDPVEDQECLDVIRNFCGRFGDKVPIVPITLKNSLAQFSAYHFNNSIIYKALIPSIIQHEPFLMNIDAGILLGDRFDELWQDISAQVERKSGDWVVGAHCHDPAESGLMPKTLIDHPHSELYPAGNLLLFNCSQYHKRNWHERFIGNYLKFIAELKYAEQELICLTAEEGEILPLPFIERRITPFLGVNVLNGSAPPLPISCLKDCIFFKFVGSFKPWKYWVLDPNKSIYTKRRAELEAQFPLAGINIIEQYRASLPREDWALGFLKAYDVHLLNS